LLEIIECLQSRPAWGAWIEITKCYRKNCSMFCRAPHGARGLKFSRKVKTLLSYASRPAWGAWIEMSYTKKKILLTGRAPHGARGLKSAQEEIEAWERVAPRMGRVD